MRFLQYCRTIPRDVILLGIVSIANVILLAMFFSHLQYSNITFSGSFAIGVLALFCQILFEITLPIGVGLFCLSRSWPWRILAYMVALGQLAVMVTQVTAYLLTYELITSLAIRNIYHIALVLNATRIALLIILALCSAIFIWICERAPSSPRKYALKTIAAAILFFVVCGTANFILPTSMTGTRDSFLITNNLDPLSPGLALCDVLYDVLWDRLHPDVVKAGLNVALTPADLNRAQSCGIFLDTTKPFPLIHEKIYHGGIPFASRTNTTKKPNILVMFTEGYSARLIGSYGGPYPDLTPHIDSFVKHPLTMQVKNYYNHTAATYRGIHGQLCSLYPCVEGLHSSTEKQVGYFGLVNILNQLGYSTHFLDTHRKKAAYIDEMVRDLGIQNVLTAEELSPRYLANAEPLRCDALSDHQLYKSLIGFLKDREKAAKTSDTPFFAALYNLETHAMCKVASDGVCYRDSNNYTLDTVHNLDDAFGLFWEAFQKSPLAKNTVVVFTADHCHFMEPSFAEAVTPFDPNYKRIFFDRIPLVIYDPTHDLPETFDAQYATSIDFTPTLVHMLGFPNQPNPFLGASIFDTETKKTRGFGIAYFDNRFYLSCAKGIQILGQDTEDDMKMLQIQKILNYTKALEKTGRIWPTTDNIAIAGRARALSAKDNAPKNTQLLGQHHQQSLK